MMALQGVEMVILGYNTPATNSQYSSESAEQRMFHHRLVLQAAAQQNSTWVVAIAKAGVEDDHALIGGSVIVNPDGIIVAETNSDADELIVHSCNLDDCLFGKQSRFDFSRHRRIEHYRLITEQTGVVKPLECDSLSRSCESESKILSASSGSHDAGMDFLDLSPR